jgi:hypothetical protein
LVERVEFWLDKTSDPAFPLWVTPLRKPSETNNGDLTFHKQRDAALATARKLARKSGGRVIERDQFGNLTLID